MHAVIHPINSPLRAVDKTRPGDIVHMSGYSFAAGGLPLNVSFPNVVSREESGPLGISDEKRSRVDVGVFFFRWLK